MPRAACLRGAPKRTQRVPCARQRSAPCNRTARCACVACVRGGENAREEVLRRRHKLIVVKVPLAARVVAPQRVQHLRARGRLLQAAAQRPAVDAVVQQQHSHVQLSRRDAPCMRMMRAYVSAACVRAARERGHAWRSGASRRTGSGRLTPRCGGGYMCAWARHRIAVLQNGAAPRAWRVRRQRAACVARATRRTVVVHVALLEGVVHLRRRTHATRKEKSHDGGRASESACHPRACSAARATRHAAPHTASARPSRPQHAHTHARRSARAHARAQERAK